MELKDIIQLFMSNKKTYGIITLIALVFGIIVVISIPKQYTAKVMLSPETNNDISKLGGLGSIASSMGLNMNNSNTDAIGPQFYPNVVSSTSFIVGLFDIKIKSDDGKIQTSLYDYLKNYQKSPWWSMLNPLGWIATTEKSETNNKKIDAFRLTENQTKIVTNLKGMISCSVDQETNIITIKVTAQDPLISAVLVDSVSNRLQAFITDYRTSKAKHDLAYTKKLYVEALADYKKSHAIKIQHLYTTCPTTSASKSKGYGKDSSICCNRSAHSSNTSICASQANPTGTLFNCFQRNLYCIFNNKNIKSSIQPMIIHSITDNIKKQIGNLFFWLLIFVILFDPTGTILHKKDLMFVLVVAFNILFYKPDWSKLPWILLLFCAITIPYLISCMRMTLVDETEVLAVYKAISPVLLLLWIRNYDLIKLSKGPVVICCILMTMLFFLILYYPQLEAPIYYWQAAAGFPIIINHRTFLGISMFVMYLKSYVAFVFIIAYYFYVVFSGVHRNILTFIYLFFICFAFSVSGTRSTMLLPSFMLIIVGYITSANKKYAKYILYPIIFIIGLAFIILLIALISDTGEASNAVKYGHIPSYIQLFEEHPEYILIVQVPGAFMYSEGFNKVVFKTEWTYLELVRNYGLFSLIIIGVFAKPLITMWKHRRDAFCKCMFFAYLSYLLIAGTNPLLLSSTGMIVLLMAYSYEESITSQDVNKQQK